MSTAIFPSETLARRAQKFLAMNGYTCALVRLTTPKEGCRYGLNISEHAEEVETLLQNRFHVEWKRDSA